ncbi:DUF4271 domain-containing protein [Sungkyunkwania multivorans]|uniref:DUF4271 domain-containing protein n=1 Tax=Sungkyunkwania multivorans TaxID=1173618 RepID=A0ABW3CV51_9FLAO
MTYHLRHIATDDWMTIIFMTCLLLIVTSKALFPFRFIHFHTLPTSNKYLLLYGKDKNPIPARFNILLFVVQVLSFSALIVLALYQLEVRSSDATLFIQVTTFLTAFVGLKYLLEKIVAVTFEFEGILDQYNFQKLSYRNLIAQYILPLLLLTTYAPFGQKTFFFVTIVLFGLLNCISFYIVLKNHQNLISKHFFYFILYLCAFEIAPYLIVYKLVSNRYF